MNCLFLLIGLWSLFLISTTLQLESEPQSPDPSTVMRRGEEAQENNRPIIGILVPEFSSHPRYHHHDNQPPIKLGLEAQLVKYLEGGGARVVPIMSTYSKRRLKRMFNRINGLFLPGASVNIRHSEYNRAGKYLFQLAIDANDKGDYFPILGECFGLQFMMHLAAGSPSTKHSIRSRCNQVYLGQNLNFTKLAPKSRLYGKAERSILYAIAHKNVTSHEHRYCVKLEDFKSAGLNKLYRVLTTNYDASTKTNYVSSAEGINYPFYALGFNPERSLYDFNEGFGIPHSKEAAKVAQYFTWFFVNESRKSGHRFESPEKEVKYLISKYSITSLYSKKDNNIFRFYLFMA